MRIEIEHIQVHQYQCPGCSNSHFSDVLTKDEIIVSFTERSECSVQFRRDKNIIWSCGYGKSEHNKEEEHLSVDQSDIDALQLQHGLLREQVYPESFREGGAEVSLKHSIKWKNPLAKKESAYYGAFLLE